MLLKGILFSSKQAGRPTWSANVSRSTHQLTATCAAAPAIVINYPRRAFLQPPPRPLIVTDATIKLLLNNQILNKLSTPSSSPTWLAPLLYTVISAAVVQYSSPPAFYIKFPVFFYLEFVFPTNGHAPPLPLPSFLLSYSALLFRIY